MIITLIGSRQTPSEALKIMKDFVEFGNQQGYLFRSGGANGADDVVTKYAAKSEIYVPWLGFNGVYGGIKPFFSSKHRTLVEEIHPAFDKLSSAALKLHMRNINQVLGPDIDQPLLSDLVVCWTENGEEKGGTATAIKLAKRYNIPIINLGREEDVKKLQELKSKLLTFSPKYVII